VQGVGVQRLSGLDAGFLYMVTPTLHMHTLKVAVLEPPPGGGDPPLDWVRARIAERLHLVPVFRRRVVEVPFRFHHPVWIEDPDFAIEHHVRTVRVAEPGDARAMDGLIGELASRPLDRSRPLWELYLISGLEGGRIGVLVKIHHAAADGNAASQLLANVMTTFEDDVEPSVPVDPWRPEPVPSRARLLVDAFLDHLRQPLDCRPGGGHRRQVGVAGAPPPSGGAVPRGRSSTPAPCSTPRSPRIAVRHHVGGARRRARVRAFGVTVNDVLLAMVGHAVRSTSSPGRCGPPARGGPGVERQAGGTSVRREQGSNLFTTLATDRSDPVSRLQLIHEVTSEAKAQQLVLGVELMQNWVQYTPPGPLHWFMRGYSRFNVADRHAPPLNVVVSNVPGPREPLYAGGARLDELYSVGPVLEGIGLNITAWSYLDRLSIGVLGCRETLPGIEGLLGSSGAGRAGRGRRGPGDGVRATVH
jgi:diacylglycerol O-acyltransferase